MFDRGQVRRSFSGAATRYQQSAALQAEVEDRLLERLSMVEPFEPGTVVDLGAGPGRASRVLQSRFAAARLLALDLSHAMLGLAPDSAGRVVADAHRLPLADSCVDLLFSSLMLQWCSDPGEVLAEARRVLRPDGILTFTTLGPDTLKELRAAWAGVDAQSHVSPFVDMHHIGDAMLATGFVDPVVDAETIVLTYQDVRGLMGDLKSWGAHNLRQDRSRGMTGKGRLAAMIDAYEAFRDDSGRIPATFEVIFGFARGAPEGQPRRTEQGDEASFSVEHLKRSGRRH